MDGEDGFYSVSYRVLLNVLFNFRQQHPQIEPINIDGEFEYSFKKKLYILWLWSVALKTIFLLKSSNNHYQAPWGGGEHCVDGRNVAKKENNQMREMPRKNRS